MGAKDVANLKTLGVTHILNAAYIDRDCDVMPSPSLGIPVVTNAKFYKDKGLDCEFLGIPAQDYPGYDLSVHFNEAADFIDSALQDPKG
jgi:atypical dual specificity phosphatase